MSKTKVIDALQALLTELQNEKPAAHAATTSNVVAIAGRSAARKDYSGGNAAQDLMDVCRRLTRYAKMGKAPSKKERNLARKVMKEFKKSFVVYNTNGVDVWTLNRL